MINKLLPLLLSISILITSKGLCQSEDTLSPSIKKKWHQTSLVKTAAVPALLIGYGVSTIGNSGFYSSKEVRNDLQSYYRGFHTKFDNITQTVPLYAVYGLNLVGVKGKHNFVNRTLIYAISNALMATTVNSLKRATKVQRPDGSNYSSFPSLHTATAFCAATFMHEEFKHLSPWYGVAGYSVATATGLIRMLNDEHWKSDVFVGAGIGILSSKVTYLVYPWIQDQISKGRNKNPRTAFTPIYNGQSVGFAFVHVLE
jgi:membrane-associated phospholipid phosphatase